MCTPVNCLLCGAIRETQGVVDLVFSEVVMKSDARCREEGLLIQSVREQYAAVFCALEDLLSISERERKDALERASRETQRNEFVVRQCNEELENVEEEMDRKMKQTEESYEIRLKEQQVDNTSLTSQCDRLRTRIQTMHGVVESVRNEPVWTEFDVIRRDHATLTSTHSLMKRKFTQVVKDRDALNIEREQQKAHIVELQEEAMRARYELQAAKDRMSGMDLITRKAPSAEAEIETDPVFFLASDANVKAMGITDSHMFHIVDSLVGKAVLLQRTELALGSLRDKVAQAKGNLTEKQEATMYKNATARRCEILLHEEFKTMGLLLDYDASIAERELVLARGAVDDGVELPEVGQRLRPSELFRGIFASRSFQENGDEADASEGGVEESDGKREREEREASRRLQMLLKLASNSRPVMDSGCQTRLSAAMCTDIFVPGLVRAGVVGVVLDGDGAENRRRHRRPGSSRKVGASRMGVSSTTKRRRVSKKPDSSTHVLKLLSSGEEGPTSDTGDAISETETSNRSSGGESETEWEWDGSCHLGADDEGVMAGEGSNSSHAVRVASGPGVNDVVIESSGRHGVVARSRFAVRGGTVAVLKHDPSKGGAGVRADEGAASEALASSDDMVSIYLQHDVAVMCQPYAFDVATQANIGWEDELDKMRLVARAEMEVELGEKIHEHELRTTETLRLREVAIIERQVHMGTQLGSHLALTELGYVVEAEGVMLERQRQTVDIATSKRLASSLAESVAIGRTAVAKLCSMIQGVAEVAREAQKLLPPEEAVMVLVTLRDVEAVYTEAMSMGGP